MTRSVLYKQDVVWCDARNISLKVRFMQFSADVIWNRINIKTTIFAMHYTFQVLLTYFSFIFEFFSLVQKFLELSNTKIQRRMNWTEQNWSVKNKVYIDGTGKIDALCKLRNLIYCNKHGHGHRGRYSTIKYIASMLYGKSPWMENSASHCDNGLE